MLSHPANPEFEEAAPVVTATSLLREAAANRRRHPSFREFLGQFDVDFFFDWFFEGPRRVLMGKFTPRNAGFMIAAALPAILAALFLTIPGMLFQTPQHFAFFHFARIIEADSVSFVPVALGTLSSLFSFRFPLCS